jgi:hypothetical protein
VLINKEYFKGNILDGRIKNKLKNKIKRKTIIITAYAMSHRKNVNILRTINQTI